MTKRQVGDRVYYVDRYVGRGAVIDNDVTGTITGVDEAGRCLVDWDDADEYDYGGVQCSYFPEQLVIAG